MIEKYKKKLKKIYNHFGEVQQDRKLLEEIDELRESEGGSLHELEEKCDVLIVLYQQLLFHPLAKDLIKYKIDRTLKRIKKGYYSNGEGNE